MKQFEVAKLAKVLTLPYWSTTMELASELHQ